MKTTTLLPLSLSLDLVAASYRSETIPARWTAARRERAALDYRRFLALAQAEPGAKLAPTKDIDLFWHLHMLHPVDYFRDCQRLFGAILDHDGGFGATAEEAPLLREAFDATAARWASAFGTAYGGAVKCTRNCVSRCVRRCATVGPSLQA